MATYKKKPGIKAMSCKQVKEKLNKLKGERGLWETHWQDVQDYVNPRKNSIIRKVTPGDKRQFQLLDNVGVHSNELLAGALHGLLTNPNAMWFELTTGNLALDNDDAVRLWQQETARTLHHVLNNSNFQMEVHEMYIDLTSIGTSAMLIEEDKDMTVRFSTKFIADYWVEENNRGFIDQLYREWKWNASQCVKEFGRDNLPEKVQKAFDKGDENEQFCVTHSVYPRYMMGDYPPSREPSYISQYDFLELDYQISVETFNEFPYVVPRWTKAAGETYGRSPGMNALPELKVLNRMNETMLIGAQKLVDPPLQMEDDGVVLPVVTRPGGLNYRRPGSEEIKPIFNDTRMDFGYQAMEDRRKRVRDAYYVDQLQLQVGGPMMTATEVLQRTEEKMRLLGPMLGRQQSEFLRPLIDRVFNICWRAGRISPPPDVLQGRDIDVRYSSLIAKSQRLDQGQSIMRTLEAVAPFGQINPSVWDNFNGDKAARGIAGIFGFPQEFINTQKDVQKTRDDRAQAAQAQAAQEQQQQTLLGAESMAKTLSLVGE